MQTIAQFGSAAFSVRGGNQGATSANINLSATNGNLVAFMTYFDGAASRLGTNTSITIARENMVLANQIEFKDSSNRYHGIIAFNLLVGTNSLTNQQFVYTTSATNSWYVGLNFAVVNNSIALNYVESQTYNNVSLSSVTHSMVTPSRSGLMLFSVLDQYQNSSGTGLASNPIFNIPQLTNPVYAFTHQSNAHGGSQPIGINAYGLLAGFNGAYGSSQSLSWSVSNANPFTGILGYYQTLPSGSITTGNSHLRFGKFGK